MAKLRDCEVGGTPQSELWRNYHSHLVTSFMQFAKRIYYPAPSVTLPTQQACQKSATSLVSMEVPWAGYVFRGSLGTLLWVALKGDRFINFPPGILRGLAREHSLTQLSLQKAGPRAHKTREAWSFFKGRSAHSAAS